MASPSELAGMGLEPDERAPLLRRLQSLREKLEGLEHLVEPWVEPLPTIILDEEDDPWPTKT